MTIDEIEKLFVYEHLPDHLQKVSRPFHDTAHYIATILPESEQLTRSMNKLWEAKNLAVWCAANSIPPEG